MSLAVREKNPLAPHLCKLQPSRTTNPEQHKLSIIIVPDIPFKTQKAAVSSAWAQLREVLTTATGDPFILAFEYPANRNLLIWSYLAAQSEALIKDVLTKADTFHLFNRPLLFVAHGLGGIIVKQVLNRVFTPYLTTKERKICDVYSGTVFFGTPHPTSNRKENYPKLTQILKIHPLFNKAHILEAEHERALVLNVSKLFNERHPEIPVLTICEKKKTNISTSLIGSARYVPLVDETLATTGVFLEAVIKADWDHREIFQKPPQDEMFAQIQMLIERISLRKVSRTAKPSSGTQLAQIHDELEESSEFSGELVEEPEEIGPASDEAVQNTFTERSSSELPALLDFVFQEKSLSVPYHLMKPAVRNPDFFGRDQLLKDLDRNLLPIPSGMDQLCVHRKSAGFTHADTTKQRSYAICGLGGVGKTQVAIEYAFSRRDKFDAIFWIDSDQPTQLSESFSIIAAQLGHTDSPDQDRVVSQNIALEWLCNPKKRGNSRVAGSNQNANWLLIFNNADDLDIIQGCWPHCDTGSVLVTSRDPLAKRNCTEGMDLEPFDPKDAAQLLLRSLKFDVNPSNTADALELSEKLGGLPLAITQVAALIERWDMTLREFLEHYESQTSITRIAKNKPADTHSQYKHSLFTVWALETLTPNALALLQVMAFFSPDSIQERLLRQYTNSEPPPNYPSNENEFVDARTDLIKVSLVTRHKSVGAGKAGSELSLHRLVQDVARAQAARKDVPILLIFCLRLLLSSWPGDMLRFDHNSATWTTSEGLLPHILKLRASFQTLKPHHSYLIVRKDYARLLLFAGWYLLERSDHEAAKPLFLDVLDLCQAEPVETATIRADVLFALSSLSAQINEKIDKSMYYAREHFEARVKLRDGSQDGEYFMAMAYGELAHIQMIAGQYEEAIQNANEGIEMTWKSPLYLAGDDWPTFAHSHKAFSSAMTGKFDEALKLIQDTLNYWGSRSSSTHGFALGITYRVLAFVKKQQGHTEEAREAYALALKHFKATVGDHSTYTSQCCRNLGEYHRQVGNFETSTTYFKQAIKGYRRHVCYRPELAWSLYGLSLTQHAEGDETLADATLEEAKAEYLKAVGEPLRNPICNEQFESRIALPAR